MVVRNHDHSRPYTVTLELTSSATPELTTTETVDLAPGEIRCLSTVAPRGATRVRARLPTGAADTTDGRLGGEPAETALVETGNGVVSVTHGL